MKKIYSLIKVSPSSFIFILLIDIMNVALVLLDMYFLNNVINSLIKSSDKWKYNLIILTVISIGTIFIRILSSTISGFLKVKIKSEIRTQMLNKIINSKYSAENDSTTINFKLLKYSDVISDDIFFAFLEILSNLMIIFSSVGLMFYYHWILGLVILIFGALSLIVPMLTGKLGSKSQNKLIEIERDYNKKIDKLFTSRNRFYMIQKLNVLNNLAAKITNDTYSKSYKIYKKIVSINLPAIIVGLLAQFSSPLISSILARFDFIDLSVIGISSFVFGFVFSSLSTLPTLVNGVVINYPKMKEYLTSSVITENKNLKIDNITFMDFNPTLNNKVLYKDNLNLTLEGGGKYIIKGENGIGKSVLFSILKSKDIKYRGKIKINKGKTEGLIHYNNIVFLNEKPHVFHGTLKDNINFFRDNYKINEIKKYLNEFDLNIDLDSLINVNKISTGQKQKIAIIRALIKDPDYLFLDESLNSLDDKTGNKIINKLLEMKGSVIWITHKRKYDGFKEIKII